VGVLAFATMFTLLSSFASGPKLENRMKAVAVRRDELKRRSRQAMAKEGALRHSDTGFHKDVVGKAEPGQDARGSQGRRETRPGRLSGAPSRSTASTSSASPRRSSSSQRSASICSSSTTSACILMARVTATMAAAVIGFYAPNIYLSNVIAKRQQSIMQAFPDALDLLLICVESGMSIEGAIQKVSQEIGGSSIELAEEMSLLSAELSYLPERRQAYEGLAKRTNHAGVKSVATAMVQAEQYGTPLGSALRTMAKENRDLRMSAAEKKAAALPAKLTVPMIIFFLPVLFVVILGPAIINIQDTMAKSH
jgi:tight adherence protein C